MSQIGFVYILVNDYMPEVYKVGCTERSPHARADELSKATGVPAPFDVLCFIEVPDFQQIERSLHQWLKNFRISDNREFFHHGLDHAIAWMWWHRDSLGFHGVPASKPYDSASFLECMREREILDVQDMHHLDDPWEKKPEVQTPPEPGDDALYVVPELQVVGGTES